MKKRFFSPRLVPSLLAFLLLASCAPAREEASFTVVCTTYPIYLFASAITEGVEGVAVERLDTGSTSCLHDYSLSMADMKKLERADVIAINGAGLEEFLEDALETSDAQVIDCSLGVELLENLSHRHDEDEGDHDGHDHGHWDPHYWMDPYRAIQMADNLAEGLSQADPEHQSDYHGGYFTIWEMIRRCTNRTLDQRIYRQYAVSGLITFHDGFQYFASFLGVPLVASIEEEAGSEASAREIVEITRLVKEYGIPVIFTEVNGSDATANAVARETGCSVAELTMIMDGPDDLEAYYNGIVANSDAIYREFIGGEETRR